MGCDIHAHLEIKVSDEWHYFAPVDLWRNYAVFAKMAGVRNYQDTAPIAKPRGLPGNMSFMTNLHSDRYGSDGHSHSWLNLSEIEQLLQWMKDDLGYKPWGERTEDQNFKWNDLGVWLFGNPISGLIKYPNDYPAALQDVRLVFWFDN